LTSAFTVWCTGLPSSGKSALADAVAAQLRARGLTVDVINSGRMRQTPLGANLGFSREDRDTNVRRHAFAAHMLVRNDVVAVVSAVSPFRATRQEVRDQLNDFVEVYVSTPRAACIDRDKEGMWAKALNGDIRNFTGVDGPYEAPESPEAEVDLSQVSVEAGARRVLATLERLGRIAPMKSAAISEDDALLDPGLSEIS
jgi:adenylyl-sulfate kinase